jgi:hypothetical protein
MLPMNNLNRPYSDGMGFEDLNVSAILDVT